MVMWCLCDDAYHVRSCMYMDDTYHVWSCGMWMTHKIYGHAHDTWISCSVLLGGVGGELMLFRTYETGTNQSFNRNITFRHTVHVLEQ